VDFVVECMADENSDSFEWAPKITVTESADTEPSMPSSWDARADFGGAVEPSLPLTRWERYAQVLLMANEAVFVD
jgi:hypothetical protein